MRDCNKCPNRGYCIPDECEDWGMKNEPDDAATSTSSN
nr:MAG TPA: Man1-Src1p-C-terminal domain [Caudoviricetes sp.]